MNCVLKRIVFWKLPPTANLIVCLLLILLVGAIALRHFLAYVTTSDLSYTLSISVQDAQSGAPVAGAKVLVWYEDHPEWRISPQRKDHYTATTDQNGTCEVLTHFRLTGSGKIGKVRLSGSDKKGPLTLQVNKTVYIRAAGYVLWEKRCAAVLGERVLLTDQVRRHTTMRAALTRLPVTGESSPPR